MDALGRRCLKCQPSSRTGENPPYGMIGGTVETSASFEARYAPLPYPTAGGDQRWSSLPRQVSFQPIFCRVEGVYNHHLRNTTPRYQPASSTDARARSVSTFSVSC